jgi:hypothetical protein
LINEQGVIVRDVAVGVEAILDLAQAAKAVDDTNMSAMWGAAAR